MQASSDFNHKRPSNGAAPILLNPQAGSTARSTAEHLLQQVGGAGGGVGSDRFFLIADRGEQAVERLAGDVVVQVQRAAAAAIAVTLGVMATQRAERAQRSERAAQRTAAAAGSERLVLLGDAHAVGGLGHDRLDPRGQRRAGNTAEVVGGGVVAAAEDAARVA